jgi:uncharacterized protein (UPF0332 family)
LFSPHNPRDFLQLASRLLTDSRYTPIETRIRTSIGRAYYAAFLVSKAKQENRGHSFPNDHTVHKCVIDSFQDDGLSHIASKLDELKGFRSDADYHMNMNFSNVQGSKCLQLAQDILLLVEKI